MRFFEIAAPQRRVNLVATKRFLENFAYYVRGYGQRVADVMREFLEFKVQNPNVAWSNKDTQFVGTGARLAEMRLKHVHLVKGKVLLIYDVKDGTLFLYDVVEHDKTEGKAGNALADRIAGLRAQDLAPYEPQGDEAPPELTPEQKADIESLMYEMAVQDRGILQAVLNGDFTGLAEFTRLTIEADWTDAQKDQAVLGAFGGQQGIQQIVQTILRNMGTLTESIDVEPGIRTVDDEGRTLISWPEFATRKEPTTCWYCDGECRIGDKTCTACKGTGKMLETVPEYPLLNVSNYNMEEVVAPLLGVEFDHTGFIEPEKLPELRRRLVRLKNGDTSVFAQGASDERGPTRVDCSGDVPRITTGARMIYPGFSPERVSGTIDRLLTIIDWAQKNGCGLRWA